MDCARVARLVWPAPILVAMLACTATVPSRPEGQRLTRLPSAVNTTSVLRGAELQTSVGANAYEIVQRQRPMFLRRRSPLNAPTVFLNLMPLGGVETLRE